MFSSTIKRSVAIVGIVAGLLAGAGPASAQVMPGSASTNFIEIGTTETLDLNTFGGNDTLRATVTCLDQDMSTVKAPVPASLVDYHGGVGY